MSSLRHTAWILPVVGLLVLVIILALVDPDVRSIALLSIIVSASATLLATVMGVPIGLAIALWRFPGRGIVKLAIYTLFGLPPVLVGLVMFILLARDGAFGALGLLFTPLGMVITQALLVLPLITGLTIRAVEDVPPGIIELLRSLGARKVAFLREVWYESRYGIIAAVMVGFGRAISEVGAVLIIGGNIAGFTRVLTTAIVLETRRGHFEFGLVLGGILLLIALSVYTFLGLRREDGL